ncbi:D-alanyl-D-alanine carboxypeptidase family protein [Virgibacillus ainsalahensis]
MRFILCIIFILLVNLIYPSSGQAAPTVSANNAILIEQSTGRVLFEKQAHETQLIASITKVLTAIIAVESGKMGEKATVSKEAIYTEGSSIYLEQGEKITIEDLVYGLMLRSGNDAAVAISEYIGGSEKGFVHLMNDKANWLGMTNSSFDNPHGLDADNHYSTAYDMALLMRYAMDNEQFKEITASTSYQSSNRAYSWQNKNKLLTQLYENSTGGKTGFTKKAGRTLISSASKNGMDLIAVTLNAPDDWRDHIAMFEWAFDNYEMESIAEEGEKNYKIKGEEEEATGYLPSDILFPLTKKEINQVNHQNYLLRQEFEPAGNTIGKVIFYLEEKPIMEAPILDGELRKQEEGFLSKVLYFYKKVIGLG